MALTLDGVNDQVDHGNTTALNSSATATWAGWFNFDSLNINDTIFSKSPAVIILYIVTVANDWRLAVSAAHKSWTTPPSTGTWTHIAVVYDGGLAATDRLKLYKNGVVEALTHLGDPPTTLGTTANSLIVGGDANSGGAFAGFQIAHWKVWSAALTAAEIVSEMHSVRPARTTNLVVWSPYDDGTNAKDYSGNGNHGTVTGTTQTAGPPVTYGAPVLIG